MADMSDDDFLKEVHKWRSGSPSASMRSMPSTENVTTPEELWQSVKKNLTIPAMLGAAGLGLDVAMPDLGLPLNILTRAGLMGSANLGLSEEMPPSLGGTPGGGKVGEFVAGAAPEAATLGGGAAISKLAERRLASRTGQATDEALQKLDPNALPMTNPLLAGQGMTPFPNRASGTQLTKFTNDARAPIQQTIREARTKYGKPIGDAYALVKNVQEPVDTQGFAGFVDGLRQSQIAPSPGAEKYLSRIKQMDPEVQRQAWEAQQEALKKAAPVSQTGSPDLDSAARNLGFKSAAEMPPNLRQRLADQLAKQHMSNMAAAPSLPDQPEFKEHKTSFDQLREMRQQVNLDLQKAKGGDSYVLGRVQDMLDDHLMDHLPPELGQLRTDYRGFIKRWGYAKEHGLENLGTPQDVADWAFKDPEMAHDLMSEAQHDPQRQQELRELFLQHVYGPLNGTTMSRADQIKFVLKQIDPYVKDPKTARMVFGKGAGDQMIQLAAWPKFTSDFREAWDKDPQFRKDFTDGMRDYMLGQKLDPDKAATQMVLELGKVDPQIAYQVKQLPGPPEKLQANRLGFSRGLLYHGTALGIGLGSGHMMGVPWQASMVGALLASHLLSNSFSTASKLGIVRPLLNAMSKQSGVEAGRTVARTLLSLGARKMQQSMDQPLELN